MIHFKNEHITVFQSALYKTTSAVIETDDLLLITDPTWLPHEVEQIISHVEAVKKDKPLYLLFTHSDFDHILGCAAFPDAKVISSRQLHENPHKNEILEQIRQFDDQYYLDRGYEVAYPKADHIVDEDGQTLHIGATNLTFYNAPGHTPDGIYTIIEPFGVWIAGDYLSDVEFPFIYDSSKVYEQTLLKTEHILQNHKINLLVPGHGNATESVNEIIKRQEKSLHYIRTLREAVLVGNKEEIEDLIKNVRYPKGMRSEHENNQKLIEKELGEVR